MTGPAQPLLRLTSSPRVEHGGDVGGRHMGQNVVHLLEDESAARTENRDQIPHMMTHSSGAALGSMYACRSPRPRSTDPARTRISTPWSIPAQLICTGLMASRPASIRSRSSGRAAAAMQHDLHVRQFLVRVHMISWRAEEFPRILGESGAALHPQIVPEQNDVDIAAHIRNSSRLAR